MRNDVLRLFSLLRESLTEAKIFVQRSMSYISIINSGMILFLLLSRLQEYGIEIYITKWFIPIFVASILVMVFVGWLDTKLGFFAVESKRSTQRNPYFNEIIDRLKRIENRLDRHKP